MGVNGGELGGCCLDCEGGLLLVHCASDSNYAVYGRGKKGDIRKRRERPPEGWGQHAVK